MSSYLQRSKYDHLIEHRQIKVDLSSRTKRTTHQNKKSTNVTQSRRIKQRNTKTTKPPNKN